APGVVHTVASTITRDRTSISGERFSVEREKAVKFYQRPENAEAQATTNSSGTKHTKWIAKKTIEEIYHDYVREVANGDEAKAPLGLSAFYAARPPDFYP